MPRRSLRALVAVLDGGGLVGNGCTSSEESVQRTDEFGRWLGRQPQIASVQASIKRNWVPPLLGSAAGGRGDRQGALR